MTPGTLTILITITSFLLAIGFIIFGLVRTFANGNVVHERVQAYAVLPRVNTEDHQIRQRSLLSKLRFRLNTLLSSLNSEKVYIDLLRANWRLTVAEFVLIRLGVTTIGFLLGRLLSGSILPGIGLAVVSYMIPGILLRRRINKRHVEFNKQLLDVIVLITGAVRAGFSLLQALEMIVREMQAPASEEFNRVIHEASLGMSVPQALQNLARRMVSDDLELVVTAIEIQYQVGGNLSTMLNAVAETIRERVRLFGEIRVITTQQRYTGYLLSILPFGIAGVLFIINPGYISRLFEPGALLCIPIGAVIGIVLGHFTIQRIARIKI